MAADANGFRSAYADSPSVNVLPPDGDADNDELSNRDEFARRTNPENFDTDGDLLPDGYEARHRPALDPLAPNDTAGDADNDGVDNLDEYMNGTNPGSGDTDNDGASDRDEIDDRADPTDPADEGRPPPADQQVMLRLTVGDDSGSHSERWALKVGRFTQVARTHGEVEFGDFPFDVGRTYPVEVLHLPPTKNEGGQPDYDWEAKIEPTPGEPTRPYHVTDAGTPTLLQPSVYHGNGVNPTAGRVAYLNIPVGEVDLAIDSDNDGTIEYAPGIQDDGIEDADGEPGKIVAVSDGDADGDGVPDFAEYDGIEGGSLVPVSVGLPLGSGGAKARVRFNYPGSAPGPDAVQRTGAGTAADPYVYTPASGQLRLWLRNLDEDRDFRDAADGGDYVVPGKEYAAEDLGFDAQMGATLWLEAVRPSTGLGDGRISLEMHGYGPGNAPVLAGSDAVQATAFTTRVVQVNADGSIGTEDKIELSRPGPAFSGTSVSVGNLRFSSDRTRILGDVTVAGSLDDALLDLIPEAEGRIDSVGLFVNGGTEAVATVGTTVAKATTPGESLAAPYDFSATFSATVPGVVLQPGWNAFELYAVDAAGHAGDVGASVEVIVTPPPDVSTDLDIRFPDGSSNPSGAATLSLSYAVDGAAGGPLTLSRVGTSDAYQTADQSVSVLLNDTWTGPVARTAEVTLPAAGLVSETVAFSDAENPGVFLGGHVRSADDQTDYAGHQVAAGASTAAIPSIAGRLNLNVVEVVAPVALAEHLGKLVVGENAVRRDVVTHQNRLYVGTPDPNLAGQNRPSVFLTSAVANLVNGVVDPAKAYPANVKPPEAAPDKTFTDGLLDGLVRPFTEVKEMAVGVIDAAERGVKWAYNDPQGAATWLGVQATAPVITGVAVGLTVYNNPEAVVASVRKAVEVKDKSLLAAAALLGDLATRPTEDVKMELIAGTHPVYTLLPAAVTQGLRFGAEMLTQLVDYLDGMTAYDKGWYTGYAVTTIALETAGALATAGMANGVTLATKLAVLSKIAPKFFKLGGKFAQTADALGLDEAGKVVTAAPGKLAPGLAVTKMCLPAGTPVHTANGLVPIEAIRAGDLVLSRDERTGEQAYKPVLDTFATRPDALYTVTYDRDGAGPIPAERVETTAPHPFYVGNRDGDGDGKLGGFVPASELEAGDELALADGSAAAVVGLDVEYAGTADDPFVTYNFEVADFHTYFVNADGVWVHNAGEYTCQQIFSIVRQVQKRLGLEDRPWDAFHKFLDSTDPKDNPASRRIYAKLWNAMNKAANDISRQSFEKAVGAGGDVDLGKIRTVGEIHRLFNRMPDPSRPGKWIQDPAKPTRWTEGLIQNHHGIVIRDGGHNWHGLLGIPANRVDDVPGLLIDRAVHGANNADLPDWQRFHQIFKQKVRDLEAQGVDLSTANPDIKNVVLNLHRNAYNDWAQAIGWGAGFGDKARAVYAAWMRREGYFQ